MDIRDFILAAQNASVFSAMAVFVIFSYITIFKVKLKHFNTVFYFSLSISLFSGGYVLHRGVYTIPRVLETIGVASNISDARENALLIVAAFLFTAGLIGLTRLLTQEKFGEILWLSALFGSVVTFLLSLLFAYYY